MLSHMDPYIGIVIFELEAGPMAAQPSFSAKILYRLCRYPRRSICTCWAHSERPGDP